MASPPVEEMVELLLTSPEASTVAVPVVSALTLIASPFVPVTVVWLPAPALSTAVNTASLSELSSETPTSPVVTLPALASNACLPVPVWWSP